MTTGDGPDGMTVDNDGNLFVATDEGIEVFAPDAARWGVIPVPQGAKSNCAFGGDDGRTLYITAPPALYRVTLAHPGPSAPPGSGQGRRTADIWLAAAPHSALLTASAT